MIVCHDKANIVQGHIALLESVPDKFCDITSVVFLAS
jgi:hypothetical protein